jgi:hypothetical protein
MNRRRLHCCMLAGLVGGAAAGAIGCVTICGYDLQLTAIELGTNENLHAVKSLNSIVGNRDYRYLAVGDAGTVVAWGLEDSKSSWTFTEVFEIGDANLHAVLNHGGWWVVGDGGSVAVSDNHGATWNTVVLADGDLHAIGLFNERPIVVGDEVVLLRRADGTWIEPPTPEGGWGQLRGIGTGQPAIVVGLGGVAWSASEPTGEWVAEPTGVDVDLFGVGTTAAGLVAIGAQGTMLRRHANGWVALDTGVSADLLDLADNYVLARGGDVFAVSESGRLNHIDTIEGAEAITTYFEDFIATVGVGGSAAMTVDVAECD